MRNAPLRLRGDLRLQICGGSGEFSHAFSPPLSNVLLVLFLVIFVVLFVLYCHFGIYPRTPVVIFPPVFIIVSVPDCAETVFWT